MIIRKKITQQSQQRCLATQLGEIQHSRQSGFTIVECLIAVVVVSVLLTAISPVIALSVATRVQARRVEQATQAARTYIDGVRVGAINPPGTTVQLTKIQYFLNTVDAPTASATTLASLYCVDLDTTAGCQATSAKDLVVQGFRSITPTSIDAEKGYRLGLRVYRADGFNDSNPLTKGTKQATFTGGLGNRKAPLVEMTTEISTQQTKYQNLCNRLGGC